MLKPAVKHKRFQFKFQSRGNAENDIHRIENDIAGCLAHTYAQVDIPYGINKVSE